MKQHVVKESAKRNFVNHTVHEKQTDYYLAWTFVPSEELNPINSFIY